MSSTSSTTTPSPKSPQPPPPVLVFSDDNVAADSAGLLLQLRGGLAILFVLAVWVTAALAPLVAYGLIWHGGRLAYTVLAILCSATVYPLITVEKDGDEGWPAFRHAIPNWGQYWHRSCGRVYEKEGPESWKNMPPTVFCYHPHGVFSQGFVLNGSMNRELPTIVGLLAGALYHAPVFRLVFGRWAGPCAPASKEVFIDQMKKGNSFGIIPGGFQEAALTKLGTDRVWIKSRKGFVKYALRYGYRLRPIFTFGECDTFWNTQGLLKLRLWMTAKNIPGVFPWGVWWCPLLPRRAHLMSVFGEPITLPKLETPSNEDVDKWHAVYLEALKTLHSRYKDKYASNPQAELEVW
eukprot:jgi/Undpi1/9338/HiC_scaffold_26.g11796.m1